MSFILLQAVDSTQATQSAQAAGNHAAAAGPGVFQFPDHWPAQGELLVWSQQIGPGLAALLVLMGVVYLLFGYNIFKGLVILNAACLGAMVGSSIGDHTGGSIPLAITCAFIFAVVTFPMMRWAVAITGGLCGAAIGVSLGATLNSWTPISPGPAREWA